MLRSQRLHLRLRLAVTLLGVRLFSVRLLRGLLLRIRLLLWIVGLLLRIGLLLLIVGLLLLLGIRLLLLRIGLLLGVIRLLPIDGLLAGSVLTRIRILLRKELYLTYWQQQHSHGQCQTTFESLRDSITIRAGGFARCVLEVLESHRFYAAPVSAINLSVILTRTAELSSVAELPRFYGSPTM